MTLVWTEDGIDSAIQVAAYLSRYSEDAASRMLIRFARRLELVDEMPNQGRMVPQYAARDVREVIVHGYHLWYRVVGPDVHVLAILHGARDLS